MTKKFLRITLLTLTGSGLMLAQAPATAPAKPPAPAPAQGGGSPVAKQPRPKSQKEVDALNAMFSAADPDAKIAASKALITNFADTEFKSLAYTMMALSYQQKNDSDNMITACEQVIQVDPKNFSAKIMIAGALAQRTKEFDLDKEEKLGRAEKLVKEAQEDIKVAPRPRPDITDAQWEGAKKDYTSQTLESLGMIAMARKKNADAIVNFKSAIETASQPDPATMVRLAALYNMENKPDDALATIDKVMAMQNLHPAIRQFAQAEKVRATQIKDKAKPAAPKP
jgi:tetratricopeptide (TPR) repeat protein